MSSVYTLLMGGLGNQIFQYAAALNFAKRNQIDNVYCDTTWLESHQSVSGITARSYALEPFGAVCKAATSPTRLPWNSIEKGDIIADEYMIHGYFQERQIVTNEITALLLGKLLDHRVRWIESMPDILRPGYSVMIHVRRGDYVTNPTANAYHGVLKEEYYQKAFEIVGKYKPTAVFVATDDVEYVRNNLYRYIPRGPYNVHVVDIDPVSTLALMTLCDAHIIANSSFSWWGARFSASSNVVYPKQWTVHGQAPQELVYPEWQGI
jgi:hypothetical protein